MSLDKPSCRIRIKDAGGGYYPFQAPSDSRGFGFLAPKERPHQSTIGSDTCGPIVQVLDGWRLVPKAPSDPRGSCLARSLTSPEERLRSG